MLSEEALLYCKCGFRSCRASCRAGQAVRRRGALRQDGVAGLANEADRANILIKEMIEKMKSKMKFLTNSRNFNHFRNVSLFLRGENKRNPQENIKNTNIEKCLSYGESTKISVL